MTSADCLDLLPSERRRALSRAYLLRLATVCGLFALALTLAAAALLLPTYLYLVAAEDAAAARLSGLSSTLAAGEEQTLARRLAALEQDAKALAALSTAPSTSALVRDALAMPRPGIALTGFVYTPGTSARPGALSISGTAATRNALRAYQLALAAHPRFSDADLPVGSYAKDTDIPFTITAAVATTTGSASSPQAAP